MKNSESRKLTNLLKRAQKVTWWGTDHRTCTLGFAYAWPWQIDWNMTGADARDLRTEIVATLEALELEGKPLTAYQREALEL